MAGAVNATPRIRARRAFAGPALNRPVMIAGDQAIIPCGGPVAQHSVWARRSSAASRTASRHGCRCVRRRHLAEHAASGLRGSMFRSSRARDGLERLAGVPCTTLNSDQGPAVLRVTNASISSVRSPLASREMTVPLVEDAFPLDLPRSGAVSAAAAENQRRSWTCLGEERLRAGDGAGEGDGGGHADGQQEGQPVQGGCQRVRGGVRDQVRGSAASARNTLPNVATPIAWPSCSVVVNSPLASAASRTGLRPAAGAARGR